MQTIREYIESLPDMVLRDGRTLKETSISTTPIWSNTICRGYLIDAMDNAHIDEETQTKILDSLRYSFDLVTYEEAERKGKY